MRPARIPISPRPSRSGGRPRLLLLLSSASYRAEDFLAAAGRLAVDVTVGSDHRNTLADEVPGATLELDFDDAEDALARIVDLHRLSPFAGVVAAEVARALGLPGNPPSAVEACRRKDLFRAALQGSRVRSPGWAVFGVERDPGEIATGLGYPCVVKPVSLAASRGVVRADDPEGFLHAFAEAALAASDSPHRRVIVEDYIPGEEVAVEGLLTAGRLEVLAILDKPDPLTGPYFEETLFVTPSRHPPSVQRDLRTVVQTAVERTGLREGPVHAELRINDEGVWPVEIAPRTIGGLCGRLFAYRTGTALEDIVLRHALGGNVRPAAGAGRGPASGAMMIPIPRPGVFRGLEGIEAALAVDDIEDIEVTARPGQRLEPPPRGHRYLGFIFARAPEPDRVERALRAAHAALRLRIDPA